MPDSLRCETMAPDGRRCCRPAHIGRHLLADALPDRDAMIRVADAWGFRGGAGRACVDGARSLGPIRLIRFIAMLEAALGAKLLARTVSL